MSEKPPKSRFRRIHLSTLLLMVLLAGTFVTLNVPRHWYGGDGSWPMAHYHYFFSSKAGWPFEVEYFKDEVSQVDSFHKPRIVLENRYKVLNLSPLLWNTV